MTQVKLLESPYLLVAGIVITKLKETTMSKQWFDVDVLAWASRPRNSSKGRLVGELVQNALDEPASPRSPSP